MSNRRKLRRPLPRCPECDSRTYVTVAEGQSIIQVDHDPWCPSWLGITPSATERYALAEALDGSNIVYAKLKPA